MNEITITLEMLKMTPIEIVTYVKGNGYDVAIVDKNQEELIRRLKKEKITVKNYERTN